MRVERELYVAPALHAERTDNLQCAAAQHLKFLIGQRLTRCDDNGVAGVDADGIEVFHVADGDGRVVRVAHHLIFNFFVALDALFHQHLVDRRERQGVFHLFRQLLRRVGKAAARAAERKGRAQDDRIADLRRRGKGLFHAVGDMGGDDRLTDALTELLEKLTILGALDAPRVRAEQLNAALIQNPLLPKLHGEVQPRLPADAGDDGIRPLEAADPGKIGHGQRLHIDLVGDAGIGHDGGGIGIGQNNLIALLPQSQAGLRARVVKFRSLADDDRAGADDKNLMDVSAFRHGPSPPSCSAKIPQTDRRCPAAPVRSPGDTGR